MKTQANQDISRALEDISKATLQQLMKLSDAKYSHNVNLFRKLKSDFQPYSIKQLYDSLYFIHKFRDKKRPESCVIIMIFAITGYYIYLKQRKNKIAQAMLEQFSTSILNKK